MLPSPGPQPLLLTASSPATGVDYRNIAPPTSSASPFIHPPKKLTPQGTWGPGEQRAAIPPGLGAKEGFLKEASLSRRWNRNEG